MRGPDWLTRYPIAHRGLHNDRRIENTLPAIEAAVMRGFAVEIDVRITADDHVAVFHDAGLARLTTESGLVAETPMASLAHARFRSSRGTIPSLDEALEAIGGRRPVFVELKTDWTARERLVPAVIAALARYGGPAAVMSFDHAAIRRVRALAPGIVRGLVVGTYDRADYPHLSPLDRLVHRHVLGVIRAAPHFVAADIQLGPASIPALLRRFLNMRLLVWTVRTEDDRARAVGRADQIIFEEPPTAASDALRQVASGLDELLSPEA